MQIAILDDDPAQAEQLERSLRNHGHVCTIVSSASAMISLLRRGTFDLLICDWMLPESSGVEVVEWVRKNITPAPPILMVTARADEADIVQGLKAGADDYVTKPVSVPVLIARVDALRRRAYGDASNAEPEIYGGYILDTAQKRAFLHGEPSALTAKEFELALILFRNANRALSRSYILDSVWGWNAELTSRTLDIHVSRVRTKLALRQENGVRLAPVYGYGYRLEMATARKVDDAGDP
jgi:DNA-binding response OmpR family regulator